MIFFVIFYYRFNLISVLASHFIITPPRPWVGELGLSSVFLGFLIKVLSECRSLGNTKITTLSIFDLMCVHLWMSCVLTNPLRPEWGGSCILSNGQQRAATLLWECSPAWVHGASYLFILWFTASIGGKKHNKRGVQVCSRFSDNCRSQSHNYFSL